MLPSRESTLEPGIVKFVKLVLRELEERSGCHTLDRNRKNSRVSPGTRGFEADWPVPALGQTTVWRLAPKTVISPKMRPALGGPQQANKVEARLNTH